MPLETGTYISDFNSSNPAATDEVSKADDHLRWIKSAILATFPSITGAVTGVTQTILSYLGSSTALSVLGRSANSAGAVAPIAGTDGQVLRVSGTALGFGTVVAAGIASDAVTTVKILDANVTMVKLGPLTGLTDEATVATDDSAVVYDLSATASRRMTWANIWKIINSFTVDSTPDQTADYVATYDASATAAKKVLLNKVGTGKKKLWIPAGSFKPRTTNGPASGNNETATNDLQYGTLDFDATTEEGAWFAIAMPKGWNESTVTFRPVWTHPATTVNFGVVFSLSGVAFSDDDALDAAAGTAQTSTDTGGTTEDLYRGPESSAITIAGTPLAEDVVFFLVKRVVGDAGDTMAVDAKLIGIELFVTTDANTED